MIGAQGRVEENPKLNKKSREGHVSQAFSLEIHFQRERSPQSSAPTSSLIVRRHGSQMEDSLITMDDRHVQFRVYPIVEVLDHRGHISPPVRNVERITLDSSIEELTYFIRILKATPSTL